MRTTAHDFLEWLGDRRRATVVMLVLAALLCVALIFAILGWNEARIGRDEVHALEAAELADERATIIGQYESCKAGVPLTAQINVFLVELKGDYLERAATTRELAQLDPPGSPERKLRLEAAARLEAKAGNVPDFPVRTEAQCAETRDRGLRELGEEVRGPP
jgi:hypothetical protein